VEKVKRAHVLLIVKWLKVLKLKEGTNLSILCFLALALALALAFDLDLDLDLETKSRFLSHMLLVVDVSLC
jgi:hypothetical protein